MKWGVRRYQNKDGSLTSAGAKRYGGDPTHDDYKRAHNKRHISQMSDKELRERNNRLQMEQQYKNLTKKKSKTRKVVNAFIGTAATITAVTNAAKVYQKVGNGVVDKIGNWIVKDITGLRID
jgi:hypothetical protein